MTRRFSILSYRGQVINDGQVEQIYHSSQETPEECLEFDSMKIKIEGYYLYLSSTA